MKSWGLSLSTVCISVIFKFCITNMYYCCKQKEKDFKVDGRKNCSRYLFFLASQDLNPHLETFGQFTCLRASHHRHCKWPSEPRAMWPCHGRQDGDCVKFWALPTPLHPPGSPKAPEASSGWTWVFCHLQSEW